MGKGTHRCSTRGRGHIDAVQGGRRYTDAGQGGGDTQIQDKGEGKRKGEQTKRYKNYTTVLRNYTYKRLYQTTCSG